MSVSELPHDPADLLDEFDAITREQELLRFRTIALAAKYRALESHADRFNKPGPDEWSFPEEYGDVNVKYSAIRLEDAVQHMESVTKFDLAPGRKLAVKVRQWPQPEREQADRAQTDDSSDEQAAVSSALANYEQGLALRDRGQFDRGER